ncbi:LysR family transcriptional regulator [Arvimicrobium flavum]|uniref:LysR family transcriptional regulator n=1 Tax=Arvimicrobium flavum TaxID=3393320 RepID=UPI00237C0111|nr:LysR family transcriptional regulator [Mesorhizobium shangrilense]
MRLEWLEDIIAVAETGSFSEAAERRSLTQSAFSRRIQNIEDHVGVELFDRTHKPVQLRATTTEQRERIVRLAEMLRQLVVDLKQGEQVSANRIVISSQHALTASLTPSIIEAVQSSTRDTYVKLHSANQDECFAQLLSRQADIAIVYRLPGTQHPVRPDFVECVTIGTDRLIPVVAAGKVDALEARLGAGEVHHIAYPPEVFLGQVMERTVMPQLRQRFVVVPRAETALTLAAVEMAAVGLAVAWAPMSLAGGRLEAGQLVDLSHVLPGCDLEVTAVRLFGEVGSVELAVWSQILETRVRF